MKSNNDSPRIDDSNENHNLDKDISQEEIPSVQSDVLEFASLSYEIFRLYFHESIPSKLLYNYPPNASDEEI